jgi:hypothetical protein
MQIPKRAVPLFLLQMFFCSMALAQDGSQPCTKDSVVLTHCADQVPSNGLPAAATQGTDQQQKQDLQRSLDRQRERSSAAATQTDDDGNLQRVEVTGVQQRKPSESEIFDKDLGTAKSQLPLTTQTSDSMGNKTECISKCAGPACCKDSPANPATPGVVNPSTP